MRRTATWAAVAASVVGLVVVAACGTDPSGVESCRRIEEARCRKAPECPDTAGIDLNRPVPNGSGTGDKVESCILWYRDACLHGLTVGDPGAVQVDACIDAIRGGDCNTVAHPENTAACSWLGPTVDPQRDAGSDGAK
ncbi:hypothetical protein [Pendulispora albinea]|uniref:Lipoprotein n=1 Tax=Pendulispora albinea TaxID=2741071 RepID=A0ABZ2M9P0_9BACT